MRLEWLCWYLCGLSAVLMALSSFISYVPGPGRPEVVLPAAFGCGALAAAVSALSLRRLPPDHWLHRSPRVYTGFVMAAIAVTALVFLFG
jgi:hypothetical protein